MCVWGGGRERKGKERDRKGEGVEKERREDRGVGGREGKERDR